MASADRGQGLRRAHGIVYDRQVIPVGVRRCMPAVPCQPGTSLRGVPTLPSTAKAKLTFASALLLGAIALNACGEAIPNVPNGPNGPAIPERQVIAKTSDTPGRLLRDRGVLILETRGTLFQAGVQQGTLMRERIRDLLRDYHERRAFSAFVLTPGFVHRLYAARQERLLTPDERDFLRGLATGSGFSVSDLLLLSAEPPYAALSNTLPSLVPGGGTFIARGKANLDGKPMIGRVSDDLTFGIRQRYRMLWVHRPETGPAWVALTQVGSLAAEAAWNADGLFVSIDPVPGSPHPMALPPRWLTLRLMNTENPDAAEAELRKAASRTSQAFVGTLAKGEGARLVEANGSRVAARSYGSGGALADLALSMGSFKGKGMAKGGDDSRDERFGRLLSSQYGQLDPDRARRLLSDLIDPASGQRGPTAHSISRSVPVRMAVGPVVLGDWGSLTSTTALVAQPLDRRLWISVAKDQLDDTQTLVDFRLDALLEGTSTDPAEPRGH